MPGKKKSSSKKGESLFTIDRFNQLKTALMPLVGPGLLFAAIFCALALLTYDAADAPSEFVAPANEGENIQNAMGSLGALLAARLFGTFGTGVWLAVIGAIMLLIQSIRGQETDHLWVRAGGVVMSTLALAALWARFASGFGILPDGNGGAVGAWVVGELGPRFGWLGTPIICGTGLAIGLWCAADRMLSPILARLPFARLVQYCRESITVVINLVQPEPATAGGARSGGRKSKKAKPTATVAVGGTESTEEEEEWGEDEGEDEYELMDANEEEDWEEGEEEEEEEEEDTSTSDAVEEMRRARSRPTDLPPMPIEHDGRWDYPNVDMLQPSEKVDQKSRDIAIAEQANLLMEAFNEFNLEGKIKKISAGPSVTMYSIKLARGTKSSAVMNLEGDLARAMEVQSLRIIPNIGNGLIGVEVPNEVRQKVRLREILEQGHEAGRDMNLPMYLGKDAMGEPMVYDLTEMPHMLIAGTTGSGKSVCINTILMSWLFTKRSDELKLVLVDPKQVEFDAYKSVPHLACPVVTETPKAKNALDWAAEEMEERYKLLKRAEVRSITEYNELSEEELFENLGIKNKNDQMRVPKKLHYIVIVVDELADLILEVGKDAETPIVRIAQKARAVGIHLILATQRPERSVVTGLIKSNVPFRVACKVNSSLDSRIMLDQNGAELLLGNGDMLIKNESSISRGQGAFITTKEVRATARFLKDVAEPQFDRKLAIRNRDAESDENDPLKILRNALKDPIFDDCVKVVIGRGLGSATLIQNKFRIGNTKAALKIEQMRDLKIVGDSKGPGRASEVLIDHDEWEEMKRLLNSKDDQELLDGYHGEGEEDLDGDEWEEE